MLEVFLHRVARTLRCTGLAVRGRWQYRRGLATRDLGAARATFEALVSLRWTSFGGHLHLGLIADQLGRRNTALDELAVAFRLDAARFRRAAIPKTLREQVLWRETLSPGRPLVIGSAEGATRDSRATPLSHPVLPTAPDAPTAWSAAGDFRDADEARRFAALPPILPEDVAGTDIDALLERLLDGP